MVQTIARWQARSPSILFISQIANLVERGGCARSLRSLRLPLLCRGRRTSFPSFRRGKVLILHPIHHPNSKSGGEGRIRTSEGIANRFTVCPLWPLGNLSKTNLFFDWAIPPGIEKNGTSM